MAPDESGGLSRHGPVALLLAAAFLPACSDPVGEAVADVRYTRNHVEMYAGLGHDAPVLSVLDFDTEVTVLEAHRSYVHVRTGSGVIGWVDSGLLLDRSSRRELQLLARRSAPLPSQGPGRAVDTLNVHTEPYRWAPTFYQLVKDEAFEILDRVLVDRLPAAAADASGEYASTGEDYWYLVRIPGRDVAGWLLANMVYPDMPIDVAALAGGRSIVAHFRFEPRGGLATDSRDPVWVWFQSSGPGQVHDFDILRVIRWDSERERYIVIRQTSDLRGYLPVRILPDFDTGREIGTGIRFVAEADGKLHLRSYAQVGNRSLYVGVEPLSGQLGLSPPSGFGARYARKRSLAD